MDKQEFMDRKRVLFEEFLEVIETMDYPKQKDFIDNFFNHFFNSIYEEGVFEATQRVVALR
ncbi:hypothetical protein ACFTQ7_24670 [Lysinibacillus sp. NPDC056959]|uniref:hypothetical protein n=1 Tax=Lysinibacillus sp. NPDC056959 TaxID=3345981 RepID=UPI00363C1545